MNDPTIGLSEWSKACAAAAYAKKPRKGSRRDPGNAYVEAQARHQQMEAELSRALNRWQKSRAALHRIEKKLDAIQKINEE
jgi:hypothetical protein